MQVISTGLPYLVIPVGGVALAGARIVTHDLEARLASVGAKFAYLLDPAVPEGRTWDNAGTVEDVATGSAAGPVAAYLAEHGLRAPPCNLTLHQGRFVGRPSTIDVHQLPDGEVFVGGAVAPVATGTISI